MHLAAGNRVRQNWISQLSRLGNNSWSWFINSEVLAPMLTKQLLRGEERGFWYSSVFGGVFFINLGLILLYGVRCFGGNKDQY